MAQDARQPTSPSHCRRCRQQPPQSTLCVQVAAGQMQRMLQPQSSSCRHPVARRCS